MSAIGINSACLTGQAVAKDSYFAVGTPQDAVQPVKMSFADLMAGKLYGQLNTTDQSETVKGAQTNVSKESATNGLKDRVQNESVNMRTDVPGKTAQTEDIPGKAALFSQEEDVTEEAVTSAMEVIGSMLERIADILGITQDELEQFCEELGIDAGELANGDSLASLVLKAGDGEDISDLLTDSSMLEAFNELKQAVSDILEEAGMTENDLKKVVASPVFTEATGGTDVSDVSDRLKKTDADRESSKSEAPDEPEAEKEIPVTYERTSENRRSGNGDRETDNGERGEQSDKVDNRLRSSENREVRTSDVQSFISSMQNAVKETSAQNMINEFGTTVRDIVYQLVDAIKVEIGGDKTSLEMKLSPESLGHVQLNISSKEGVMTARITTENQAAREAIESQLQILKDTITSQGFKVDAIEVTVSSFSFSDSKNASHSGEEDGRHEAHREKHGVSDIGDAQAGKSGEDIMREVMLQTGSTVSYVA